MRQVSIGILIVTLLLCLSVNAFAQDTITGQPLTSLNVRSGPGTEYDIVTVIYSRNRVGVVGRTNFASFLPCPREGYPLNEWLLVDVEGIQGWVVRCGMSVTGAIEAIPVVGADGAVLAADVLSASESEGLGRFPGSIGIRAPAYGYSESPIGRARGVINIRSEPSLDAEIVLIIRYGEFFVVEESADGGWYRIEWSSNTRRRGAALNTGWVARHLVTITRWV